MAINDIKMSELPELLIEDVLDTDIMEVVNQGANKKLAMGAIKQTMLNNMYENRPLGEMSLITSATQTVTDVFAVVTAFDKIQFERGVGVDLATDKMTILEDGNYQVTVTVVAEFDKALSLDSVILVNGVATESFGNIQGLGAGKGILIGGGDVDPLVTGDELQLAVKLGDPGSTSVTFTKVRIIVARV